jgi:serine/threonine protein kinase
MTPSEESTPEEADTLVGRVIAGNFRMDRLIGSGATGNVYQAEQLSLGKAVAVKVLHPHLMSDDKLVRRFQREAKSACRLNHPNSVQIIDSGQDGTGMLYIAMELLSGRDLSEVIRDEFPLPVPRIVHIMSQVFSALDEAHAHGIIHRDLKPSNIMLIERRDEKDFVKVCDYGIAKAASEDAGLGTDSQMLTVQGLVCGTPEYMSPEQARGEVLDGRTDLYSAAVILYQMATGDVPFRAATPIGIVSRHLSEMPIVPSSRRADAAVPPDLDDLILRGLAKSRDLRPATAAIFRDELQRLGSGPGRRALANARTLPATDPSTNEGATTADLHMPKPRPGSGRGTLAIAIGAVALLAVGAAFVLRSGPVPGSSLGGAHAAPEGAAVASAAIGASPSAKGTAPTPSAGASTPSKEDPAPGVLGEPSVAPSDTGSSSGASAVAAQDDRSSGAATPTATRDRSRRRLAAASPRGARPTTGAGHAAARAQDGSIAAGKADGAPSAADTGVTAARGAGRAGATSATESGGAPLNVDDRPATVAGTTPTLTAPPASAAAGSIPSSRGGRDLIPDGERLLAQGEVAEACRRGEDAKRASPKLAIVFKFLGKCYMRAGNASLAKENFRHYLELAPNASDALFIESIVKESAK